MSVSYEPINRTNDENKNETELNNFKKYNSINDFRNSVERAISYNETRQSLVNLYHGTKVEKWFLEELVKSFDKLISYESGVQFISDINNRITDDFPAWTKAIFTNYSKFLKYECGVNLLCRSIREKKNSNEATMLIEDVFGNFEELKNNDNYFEFFTSILKIYKGDETVKEILNSFDWKTDKSVFGYLACFCHFFSLTEIQCLIPFIEDPLKYVDNEVNANILNLVLSSSDEKMAEEIINKLLPRLPSFFSFDFLMNLIVTMIDRATAEQLFSIYTAFDIALQKTDIKYPSNFDLAVLTAVKSMDWEKRFEFFSTHFEYFKNNKSQKMINLLKAMEINEKNHKKQIDS